MKKLFVVLFIFSVLFLNSCWKQEENLEKEKVNIISNTEQSNEIKDWELWGWYSSVVELFIFIEQRLKNLT